MESNKNFRGSKNLQNGDNYSKAQQMQPNVSMHISPKMKAIITYGVYRLQSTDYIAKTLCSCSNGKLHKHIDY